MKVSLVVDDSALQKEFRDINITDNDMKNFSYVGGYQIINKQKELVPFDTGDTQLSISSHITSVTATSVVNEVGPETEYAPYIEFGTSNPNYPIQPFVRPSVFSNARAVFNAIAEAFQSFLALHWDDPF